MPLKRGRKYKKALFIVAESDSPWSLHDFRFRKKKNDTSNNWNMVPNLEVGLRYLRFLLACTLATQNFFTLKHAYSF